MHNAYVPGDMVRLRTAMPALRWRLRVLRVVGHTTRGVNIYELEYVTGPGAGRVTSASGADIRKVAE